jgi:hypothetical protein
MRETHSLASASQRFTFHEFSFSGFLKDNFIVKLQNVNELRDRIVRTAESLTNEMLANTWREAKQRLDVCRATNGTHIEVYWHKRNFVRCSV